jgi:hypothetical protein
MWQGYTWSTARHDVILAGRKFPDPVFTLVVALTRNSRRRSMVGITSRVYPVWGFEIDPRPASTAAQARRVRRLAERPIQPIYPIEQRIAPNPEVDSADEVESCSLQTYGSAVI